jgi:hypothetical protein
MGMNLQHNILSYLRLVPAADVAMICEDMQAIGNRNATPDKVQPALHALDDAGLVLMKNGVYRLSEWAKQQGC